jgi:CubicO group peptidase (beta-lactamase class C family)
MTNTTFANLSGGPVNPSGGAQSTADDYMKFLLMMLNNGKYNGKQILSEEAVNEMRKVRNTPEQIKYAPKSAQGYLYASGSWVAEGPLPASPEGGRVAVSLASPGLFGTWPMIDYCRGYAYIVFVKNLLGEERANAHEAIKEIIDRQLSSSCK